MRPSITCLGFCLLLSAPASAGIPVPEHVTCPIDGLIFEVTGTASCSYFGYTMALAPVTSCDFVTHMPQCPGSGFPVYRDFTDDEVARLRDLVASDAYAAVSAQSPYYVAWYAEDYLGTDDAWLRFNLLARGLARDPGHTLADTAYLELMASEAPDALPGADPESRPFYTALTAFALIHAGHDGDAAAMLDELEASGDTAANDYLRAYVGAVRQCLADPASEFCDPTTEIPGG